MKYIFLLLAIATFGVVSAQDNHYSPWLKKHKKQDFKKQLLPRYDAVTGPRFVPENRILSLPLPQAKNIQTLPNGNRVYALPQDNMPCIVPNMNEYRNRSITIQPYHYNGPGAIPNPARPKK
ncbi:MAG: hypothetical protein ABIR18_04190 [Chitinophagaceae bacterium]